MSSKRLAAAKAAPKQKQPAPAPKKRPAAKKPPAAAKKPPAKRRRRAKSGPLELLRRGAEGVAAWNQARCTEGQRPASSVTRRANLSGLELEQVDFEGMDLRGANLAGARLERAVLELAELPKANLSGANLALADLGHSVLDDADLSGATLDGATLRQAKLRRADLRRARLLEADLREADLRGADLTGAALDGANLQEALYDDRTRLPAGFTPDEDEMDYRGRGRPPHLRGSTAAPQDVKELVRALPDVIDAQRVIRAVRMLREARFQLYSELAGDHLVGVVKSESDPSLVYSCRLGEDGDFGCCTQNLNHCGGLRGEPCKHLLVLVLGLVRAGVLDAERAHAWVGATGSHRPSIDRDLMSETLLRYKGAQSGEIDWRPTQTIPEDFYAL